MDGSDIILLALVAVGAYYFYIKMSPEPPGGKLKLAPCAQYTGVPPAYIACQLGWIK